MVVSYNWLQEYFDEKLPSAKELGNILNTRAFEVEGIEEIGSDFAIDIDVLPNRAHDCLSHVGIAKEISIHTGLKFNNVEPKVDLGNDSSISVKIEDEKVCKRYIALEINNLEVGPSPDELKQKLESLGEKSINNVVDITNVVMFELGQPLHAFDKDKLSGGIIVRPAKSGEKIKTLDNKDVELNESDLVISDESDALAIAGVKGGKKAEVDSSTKNIVLESANFLPVAVRKTRTRIGIQTESSKRFENEITPFLAEKGILRAAELIKKYCGGEVEALVDVFPRPPKHQHMTGVSLEKVNSLLGANLSDSDIENVLDKLGFEYKKVKTKECVVEEIKSHEGKIHNIFPSATYDAPDEFDCSSLIAYSYSACGLSIPRLTVDQYVWGDEISESNLEAGDLVFANSQEGKIHYESVSYLPGTKVEEGVDHVGMYIGDGKIIHSSRYEGKTSIEILEKSKHFQDIVGYRRMINKDEERFAVKVPYERLDIKGPEDLIEEIGRIYGYENIEAQPISDMKFEAKINKEYHYNNLIRKTLVDLGWSEVMTYSFGKEGEVAPLKPIAEGKEYLRTSLIPGMKVALDLNLYNADLLGLNHVKTFEIGKVHFKDDEKIMLSLGVVNNKIKKPSAEEIISEALAKLSEVIGEKIDGKISDGVAEINLDKIYSGADAPKEHVEFNRIGDVIYKTPSQYPFVLRDISMWVDGENKESEVLDLIKEKAGNLLVNNKLIDIYQKDGRTSYAFRLVFQSQEKTLNDEEVGVIMENITKSVTDKGWEVR